MATAQVSFVLPQQLHEVLGVLCVWPVTSGDGGGSWLGGTREGERVGLKGH